MVTNLRSFAVLALVAAGCNGGSTVVPGTDTGTGTDAVVSLDTSPGNDVPVSNDTSTGDGQTGNGDTSMAVAEPVNSCGTGGTAFEDHTAATDPRMVTFPTGALPAQYAPPCMLISAGQTVTFSGALASHPLTPGALATSTNTGSANNPITATSAGTNVMVTFPTPGIYPYHCAFHATMFGAIKVM